MPNTLDEVNSKLNLIVQVLQGKIEDRDDSGLIGDVDNNKYWRKRYEKREDDIDKNTDHRQKWQRLWWLWVSTLVIIIGKLIYEAIK